MLRRNPEGAAELSAKKCSAHRKGLAFDVGEPMVPPRAPSQAHAWTSPLLGLPAGKPPPAATPCAQMGRRARQGPVAEALPL